MARKLQQSNIQNIKFCQHSKWGSIKYDTHAICILFVFLDRKFRVDVAREKKTRVEYYLSIKRMCPHFNFFFFTLDLFCFPYVEEVLLRNVNNKPH